MSRLTWIAPRLAASAIALLVVCLPTTARAQASEQIACGSSSGARQTCNANGTVSSVRVTESFGETACRWNSNWGFTSTAIWTRGGCRADFAVSYRDGNDAGGNVGGGNVTTAIIRCGNRTGSRQECSTSGNATGVRLLADRSASACRENGKWGYTASQIWAEPPCWGQFEVTYRGTGGVVPPMTRTIACGSPNGDSSCNALGRVASVRLTRVRSGNCRQGATWGFGSADIWTRQGCVADFEVTYVTPALQPR